LASREDLFFLLEIIGFISIIHKTTESFSLLILVSAEQFFTLRTFAEEKNQRKSSEKYFQNL
jgi:hypothetical protein